MTLKDRFAIFVLAGSLVLGYSLGPAKADTGSEGATRTERGSYVETRVLTVSSTTGTSLFAANTKRPDGMCFNNSAFTLYLGTTSATTENAKHENIRIGFPVTSSSTFRLDGSFTGGLFATADDKVASIEVKCIDGLVR